MARRRKKSFSREKIDCRRGRPPSKIAHSEAAVPLSAEIGKPAPIQELNENRINAEGRAARTPIEYS